VKSAQTSFEWLNYAYKNDPPLSAKLKSLSGSGVPIMFIEAADDPELAAITREMFLKAGEPREMAIIAYGNRVVTFFLTRLPTSNGEPIPVKPAAPKVVAPRSAPVLPTAH